MGMANRRVAAKKVLEGAKKYAGKDVIVLSKNSEGTLYFASSMPSGTSQHLETQIKMVNEGLKTLRRIHRTLQSREAAIKRGKVP